MEGEGEYIKCFCQHFSSFIEKRIKTKGLRVEGEDSVGWRRGGRGRGLGMWQHECKWRGKEGDMLMRRKKVVRGGFIFKKSVWMKQNKTNEWVVSTQDEAGLATRWVSSAPGDGVAPSRRGGGLWRVLLLLLLLLAWLHVVRTIYRCSKERI